jgi:hypothetical protein
VTKWNVQPTKNYRLKKYSTYTCNTNTKASTLNITFSGQQCGSWTIESLEEIMDVMEI